MIISNWFIKPRPDHSNVISKLWNNERTRSLKNHRFIKSEKFSPVLWKLLEKLTNEIPTNKNKEHKEAKKAGACSVVGA